MTEFTHNKKIDLPEKQNLERDRIINPASPLDNSNSLEINEGTDIIPIEIQNDEDLLKSTRKMTNNYQRCQLLAKKSIIDDLTLHRPESINEREGNIKRDINECLKFFRDKFIKHNEPNSNTKLLKILQKTYNLMKILREQQLEKRQQQILNYSEVQGNPKYFVVKADYQKKLKFKSAEEFRKYSHKTLVAKVLATKGYGTNCIRQYTDCFKYPFTMHKNHYNTISGGIITQTLRKLQFLVKCVCRREIQAFYHQQIRLLFTPLQNYRIKLPLIERNALQKVIRITFNLSTIVISEDQILSLYVAIIRMCRNVHFTKADLKIIKEDRADNSNASNTGQRQANYKDLRIAEISNFPQPYHKNKHSQKAQNKSVNPKVRERNSNSNAEKSDKASHYSFENHDQFERFLFFGGNHPQKSNFNLEQRHQSLSQDKTSQKITRKANQSVHEFHKKPSNPFSEQQNQINRNSFDKGSKTDYEKHFQNEEDDQKVKTQSLIHKQAKLQNQIKSIKQNKAELIDKKSQKHQAKQTQKSKHFQKDKRKKSFPSQVSQNSLPAIVYSPINKKTEKKKEKKEKKTKQKNEAFGPSQKGIYSQMHQEQRAPLLQNFSQNSKKDLFQQDLVQLNLSNNEKSQIQAEQQSLKDEEQFDFNLFKI